MAGFEVRAFARGSRCRHLRSRDNRRMRGSRQSGSGVEDRQTARRGTSRYLGRSASCRGTARATGGRQPDRHHRESVPPAPRLWTRPCRRFTARRGWWCNVPRRIAERGSRLASEDGKARRESVGVFDGLFRKSLILSKRWWEWFELAESWTTTDGER